MGRLVRGFSSVVKHVTANLGIANSIPPHTYLNHYKEVCTGSFQEKCSQRYTRYVKEPSLP